MIAKEFKVKGHYQSVLIDGGTAGLEKKAPDHLHFIDRRMHEAQVRMEAHWGKQLGYTKTARALRVKCPFGNHYHCCTRHVCEGSDEL